MSDGLKTDLLSNGLATGRGNGDQAWPAFHPALAETYIALLAHRVASRNHLDASTDDPLAHRAFGGASAARMLDVIDTRLNTVDTFRPSVEPRADELQTYYVQISINAALTPANLNEVPVERIIEFRVDHEAKLQAFRDHVASLRPAIEEIARIDGIQGAKLHLEQLYRRETHPRVEQLQSALSRRRIDTALGTLSPKFEPAAVATAGLGLAGVVAAAASTDVTGVGSLFVLPVSAALTVIPYVRRRRQERSEAVAQSPASYLLSLQKELR